MLQLLQRFLTADLGERDAECAKYAANAAKAANAVVKFTVFSHQLSVSSRQPKDKYENRFMAAVADRGSSLCLSEKRALKRAE